jgi:hypothetical protein
MDAIVGIGFWFALAVVFSVIELTIQIKGWRHDIDDRDGE